MGPYASEGFLGGGKGGTEFISSAGYVSVVWTQQGGRLAGVRGVCAVMVMGLLVNTQILRSASKTTCGFISTLFFSSCSTGLDSGTVILIDGK